MSDVLELSLDLATVPVKLKKGSSVKDYELRELDGKGRDKYLQLTGKRMKYDDAGKPKSVASFEGMQAELLQFVLFDKATDKALTVEEIQNFPAKTQTTLFEKAQEINGLGDDAKAESGND